MFNFPKSIAVCYNSNLKGPLTNSAVTPIRYDGCIVKTSTRYDLFFLTDEN